MNFVRSIGRWALTGVVINTVIGSGIFGIPSELTHLVGLASPLVMILAGLLMATIMVSFAEVGSQFSEPGGCYLYVRTAFGRFLGLQVGWFWLLSILGGAAASANLFVTYFAGFIPHASHGWTRIMVVIALVAIPAAANYVGARSGAGMSSVLAIAKLLPLVLLVVLGVWRFGHTVQVIHATDVVRPGGKAWISALLLVIFAYEGYEDSVMPAGEVKDPQRSIPFALFAGLGTTIVVYALLQFATVATIGTHATDRPLGDVAAVLLGPAGRSFVNIAVMLSTYGYISSTILNGPRLLAGFAEKGDGPVWLGKLNQRFHTPGLAIIVYSILVVALALTGTFFWALVLSVGASTIYYAGVCASLIRLRQTRPQAAAVRIPWGPVWAVCGIILSLMLLSQIDLRGALFMGVTALIAAANWFWAKRRTAHGSVVSMATSSRNTD